jgi:endoglycosylceramidase
MHQDVISEKFCGEGIPDFAAIPKSNDFPDPLDEIYTDIATDGYPTRQDCAKHGWASYYNTRATSSVFQNLYNDVSQANSTLFYWSRFWEKVASEFGSDSAVLGYELINEPWAGDIFEEPKLLVPSVADAENLQPAYDYITDNIRKIDSETLIFFAAVTWDDPVPVGFTKAPGSDVNAASKSVFAYHFYLPPQLSTKPYFHQREKDTKRLQTGMMLTEFERPRNDNDYETDGFVDVANVADQHLLSWTLWEYKTFCRETEATLNSNSQAAAFGSCKTGYGEHLFWNDQGEVNMPACQKMARTYAQKVAGMTVSMKFDPVSKNFEFTYLINTAIKQPTELFVSTKYQYFNGYDVQLFPKGKVYAKSISENILGIFANHELLEDSEKIVVRITEKTA